jgi:hypothetical protein
MFHTRGLTCQQSPQWYFIVTVKMAEFVGGGILNVIPKSCWFGSIFFFFCECTCPAEDKYDDTKENVCKELQHIFGQFPKYHLEQS